MSVAKSQEQAIKVQEQTNERFAKSQEQAIKAQEQTNEKLEQIQRGIVGAVTSPKTPADYWGDMLDEALTSRTRDFKGDQAGSLMFRAESDDLDKLSKATKEVQVQDIVQEKLQEVFSPHGIVCGDSRNHPWLLPESGNQRNALKPDNFFGIQALVGSKKSKKSADKEMGIEEGKGERKEMEKHVATWELHDLLWGVAECKVEDCQAGKCELLGYLHHLVNPRTLHPLSKEMNLPLVARGMFYHKKGFYLIKYIFYHFIDEIVRVTSWELPGIPELLVDFFRQGRTLWEQALEKACKDWNLQVRDNAFLGSGGNGRVFRAWEKEGPDGGWVEVAIKISIGEKCDKLQQEAEYLEEFACKSLVRVGAFSRSEKPPFACLKLVDVGDPIRKEDCYQEATFKKVLRSLVELHRTCCHGDARIANAIMVNENVLWVDCMDMRVPGLVGTRIDFRQLMGSINAAVNLHMVDAIVNRCHDANTWGEDDVHSMWELVKPFSSSLFSSSSSSSASTSASASFTVK